MLWCSDGGAALSQKLSEEYGSSLQAEYLQMGHHGNGGLTPEFYRAVAPKVCYFDAPRWLMENKNTYDARDAAYNTPEKIALMQELGAEIHSFIDGPNQIILQ